METVDRNDLKRKIDAGEDMILIEVFSEDAFENFHLRGAINITLNSEQFEERVQAIAEKDDEVIVYCKDEDCDASPKAARRLEDLPGPIVRPFPF